MPRSLLIATAIVMMRAIRFPTRDEFLTASVMTKYQPNVEKGLEWLAKQQRKDGSWQGVDGRYSVALTSFAGMALLAEGSGPGKGKYGKHIDKAVEFLESKATKSGLFIDRGHPDAEISYMHGHSLAILFLAQVWVKEDSPRFRKSIGKVLENAIAFSELAQTRNGGWNYVSAADGNNFTEGFVTVMQFHALAVVNRLGVRVRKEVLTAGFSCLDTMTTVTGNKEAKTMQRSAGLVYTPNDDVGKRSIRPIVTAGGLAAVFASAKGDSEQASQWLNGILTGVRPAFDLGNNDLLHFYLAQVAFQLDETGHAKLRPDLDDKPLADATRWSKLLKWSRYRSQMFDDIVKVQGKDGAWDCVVHGPILRTSIALIILQLDKRHLPMCKR